MFVKLRVIWSILRREVLLREEVRENNRAGRHRARVWCVSRARALSVAKNVFYLHIHLPVGTYGHVTVVALWQTFWSNQISSAGTIVKRILRSLPSFERYVDVSSQNFYFWMIEWTFNFTFVSVETTGTGRFQNKCISLTWPQVNIHIWRQDEWRDKARRWNWISVISVLNVSSSLCGQQRQTSLLSHSCTPETRIFTLKLHNQSVIIISKSDCAKTIDLQNCKIK